MTSQSLLCPSVRHLCEALANIHASGFHSTLAIVFIPPVHDIQELIKVFDDKNFNKLNFHCLYPA